MIGGREGGQKGGVRTRVELREEKRKPRWMKGGKHEREDEGGRSK